jgi:hypothetical protein
MLKYYYISSYSCMFIKTSIISQFSIIFFIYIVCCISTLFCNHVFWIIVFYEFIIISYLLELWIYMHVFLYISYFILKYVIIFIHVYVVEAVCCMMRVIMSLSFFCYGWFTYTGWGRNHETI